MHSDRKGTLFSRCGCSDATPFVTLTSTDLSGQHISVIALDFIL
jgi:hypothetical protein